MTRNIIGSKLQPGVNEKMKLREVARKRENVPMYPYFHPQTSEL